MLREGLVLALVGKGDPARRRLRALATIDNAAVRHCASDPASFIATAGVIIAGLTASYFLHIASPAGQMARNTPRAMRSPRPLARTSTLGASKRKDAWLIGRVTAGRNQRAG